MSRACWEINRSRAASVCESLPAVKTGYGLEGGRFALETRCSRLRRFQSVLYTNKWPLCRDLIHFPRLRVNVPSVHLVKTMVSSNMILLSKLSLNREAETGPRAGHGLCIISVLVLQTSLSLFSRLSSFVFFYYVPLSTLFCCSLSYASVFFSFQHTLCHCSSLHLSPPHSSFFPVVF